MTRFCLIAFSFFLSLPLLAQQKFTETLVLDSAMIHASISLCVADAENGAVLTEYNSEKSLIPASIMKIITSAAALELLGPDHLFKTSVGYTGKLDIRTGQLNGDIIISGEGDPSLGSKFFSDHYQDFTNSWTDGIRKAGIKEIHGRVITDDSYFDYQPLPEKWLWEDIGNYYGAGVYGLSVFDNQYEIHLTTGTDGTVARIGEVVPEECRCELANYLIASGSADKGFVFSSPYNDSGWISGTVPAGREDIVLKASITDPPKLIAKILTTKLRAEGTKVTGEPSTMRIVKNYKQTGITVVTETISPSLKEFIAILNRESINLYAEHLAKELGKRYGNGGSTSEGVKVVLGFLRNAGIDTDGMFIEDGSGLSPLNSINSREMVRLLVYLKNNASSFPYFSESLPYPGGDGTLKSYFTDPVFDSRLRAKTGSMTRVRSLAGYLKTSSGRDMAFTIIINNFSGPSRHIQYLIEDFLKQTILNN
jgi:serine-type D-Ala-D-Ala carboxypeptidase/endopeptidase (penicillin-binding protein 4)